MAANTQRGDYHHYYSQATVLVLIIVALALLPLVSATDLTGAYETASTCPSTCPYPDGNTGACACAANCNAQYEFNVVNDCQGSADLQPGQFVGCITNGAGLDSFGGGYQIDDAVPNSQGCRRPNKANGNTCACPTGFDDVAYRALATTGIGSYIHLCWDTAAVGAGGAYQVDDPSTCRVVNPFTGSCTCPQGYGVSRIRAIVDGPAGSTIIVCTAPAVPPPPPPPPPPSTTICPGQTAILDGVTDVTAALTACIAATPAYGTLALPPGLYGLSNGISISSPITIVTSTIEPANPATCGLTIPNGGCVTLVALSGCCQYGGLLVVAASAAGSVFNHIAIDGNRAARTGSVQFDWCTKNVNNRQNGVNAFIQAPNVSLEYSLSANALCASGMEWIGDDCRIVGNYFATNGDHFTSNMWSDGLTLLQCRNGVVGGNTFADNSDVNLIMGCGTGTTVANNAIAVAGGAAAFAGFMMDNFDNSECGDYQGCVVVNLTINCGAQRCDFGAEFGRWRGTPVPTRSAAR